MNKDMINRIIVSTLYAVGVMLFLLLGHPELMSYQEQYQLFLFNVDYLMERLSVAGGVADYVSEFLVQFCYVPLFGAIAYTLVFVVMQQLVYKLCYRMSLNDISCPISIVPGVLLLSYMGDEDVLLSFAVALVFVLLSVWCVLKTSGRTKFIVEILLIPLLYWCAGPVVFCYVALMIICDVSYDMLSTHKMMMSIARALYSIVVVYLSYKFILTQHVASDVWLGINYHRDRLTYPVMQFVVEGAVVLMPLLSRLLLYVKIKWFCSLAFSLIFIGGSIFIVSNYDKDKYTIFYFDYCVRNERWNDVIERAEEYMPETELASNSVNLALGMTKQLGDRMFEFYQCGSRGLFSVFERNMVSCIPTAEAYYHLGMINEALRCYFDTQESILNCRKSGRFSKRLAELYIANGDYNVAMKHLANLKETLFYSSWANEMEKCLSDETKVSSQPQIKRLRELRFTEKFFFSHKTTKLLVRLWNGNKNNKLAYDYLLANIMLECDMESFYNISSTLVNVGFMNLPKHYREVLSMFAMQGMNLDSPLVPDQGSMKLVKDFNTAYLMTADRSRFLKSKWRDTYWTYCLVKYPSLNATTGATRTKH